MNIALDKLAHLTRRKRRDGGPWR